MLGEHGEHADAAAGHLDLDAGHRRQGLVLTGGDGGLRDGLRELVGVDGADRLGVRPAHVAHANHADSHAIHGRSFDRPVELSASSRPPAAE